jgi:hypothetical protein
MIDENTLRTLIEAGGVGGTIITVVWLIRPVFLKWLENIGEARKLDAKRLEDERESEKALALALNGVTTELKLSRGINEQLIDKFGLLVTRDHLSSVHEDVKTIPAEVWRLGDPKLDAMRSEIEHRVADLQASIETHLDPGAVNARAAIRLEFETMTKRLDDIDKSLRYLRPQNPNTKTKPIVGYMGNQTTKDTERKKD